MGAMRSMLMGTAATFGALNSAWALDPTLHISQYGHTAWRLQDGILAGAPLSIAQTSDGYMWIGTQAGLLRLDGVRFVPFVPPELEEPFNPQIESLLGASDGTLWIGTGNHLYRLKDRSLAMTKSSVAEIQTIQEDSQGNVWVARARTSSAGGPLCRVMDAALRCYGKEDGIPFSNASSLALDKRGDIWLASAVHLTIWSRDAAPLTYTLPGIKGDEGLAGISALTPRSDGSVMVGVLFGGGLGLQTIDRGTWKPYMLPGFDGSAIPVSSMLLDHQGALWIGTSDRGIYRIADQKIDQLGASEGLSSNAVVELYEDHEGDVWVVTSGGVDRFRDVRVVSISQHEGLSADAVSALVAARDGTIWMSNGSSLDALRQDGVSSINGSHLPGKQVTSLLEDHRGRLWVGIDDQLTVLTDGRFTSIKRRDGSPTGSVVSITEDSDDNIWAYVIGYSLLRIKNDQVQEALPESEIPYAHSMAPDPRGGIWMGLSEGRMARYYRGQLQVITFEQLPPGGTVVDVITMPDGAVLGGSTRGLVAWRDGTSRVLTMKNGLPCERIHSLILDKQSNLWLYMPCGLVELSPNDLEEMWNRADVTVNPRIFDALDGVHAGGAAFQPSSTRSPDGRLWFSNDDFVQMLDPAHLRTNRVPPPVHIEQVVADHKTYSHPANLKLPPLTSELEIDYTALSLPIPEKMRFRYKLDGHDGTWQEPGTRRQAFYTDLAPGDYRFHVVAANNDGLWNESGASLNFTVGAAWFQTKTFRLACVLLGGLLVWSIYRIRVRHLAAAIAVRFDERMAERTRLAQELHDTLLQTILASKRIADDELDEQGDERRLRATMRRLSQWLGQATQEGRAALSSLRVSLTLRNDLAEAFQKAAGDCQLRQPMDVSTEVVGEPRDLHPIARDEVYRIGYEAIRNACLHSGGTHLSIELAYAQDLTLRVTDNGVGMEGLIVESGREGHFGLLGMRERAARVGGKLSIASAPSTGTDIRLSVPGKLIFRHISEESRSIAGRVQIWLLRARRKVYR
jgi:signal transduction histidine kinase/ligand-binding sensor domain-containing protein